MINVGNRKFKRETFYNLKNAISKDMEKYIEKKT